MFWISNGIRLTLSPCQIFSVSFEPNETIIVSRYTTNAKNTYKFFHSKVGVSSRLCDRVIPASSKTEARPATSAAQPSRTTPKMVEPSLLLWCTHEYDIYYSTEFYKSSYG